MKENITVTNLSVITTSRDCAIYNDQHACYFDFDQGACKTHDKSKTIYCDTPGVSKIPCLLYAEGLCKFTEDIGCS